MTALATVGSAGCYGPACENAVVTSIESPDGSHVAVVFSRNCGATVGFNTQVSLGASGARPLEGPGNVWVADDSGATEKASWGGPQVAVTWVSRDTLELRYRAAVRVF